MADIVTGTGPGTSAHVKVFHGITQVELRSFLPYAGFAGGVFVAAGDVNGDGTVDIITGAGPGGGTHVKAFDGTSLAELRSFLAYPGFNDAVMVAAGDVNGDGAADIITGAGTGGGTHVKVFDGKTLELLHSFLAYPGFNGEVFVAAGDVNGDGAADIITGAGDGGATHVKVFDGKTLDLLQSFLAYPGFNGGVRVAAGDVNGDGIVDIITGSGPVAPAHVKAFDGRTLALRASFFAYDPAFTGGTFVAGTNNGIGQ